MSDRRIVSYSEDFLPEFKTKWALCGDVKCAVPVIIKPWEIKLVDLGIKSCVALKLYVRSSLPLNKGLILANSVGIIDADYRWPIKAMLLNVTKEDVFIDVGDRICQIEPLQNCYNELIEKEDFENWDRIEATERWEWGFGSTWI